MRDHSDSSFLQSGLYKLDFPLHLPVHGGGTDPHPDAVALNFTLKSYLT